MTLQLSNAHDSISDVSTVLTDLSNAGVDNEGQMSSDAQAILELADANNTTGDALFAKLIPAFQEYGLTVDDVSSKSDELTTISHTTQYSLTDVGNIMDMTGVKATSLGLSFDQVADVVEILGERGVPTRQAITDINDAVTKAKGNTDAFYSSLNITSGDLDTVKTKFDNASGSTAAYNAIVQQNTTAMQNLAHDMDLYETEAGKYLVPLQGIATLMSVVGPAITVTNAAMALYTSWTKAHAAAATEDTTATAAETEAIEAEGVAAGAAGAETAAGGVGIGVGAGEVAGGGALATAGGVAVPLGIGLAAFELMTAKGGTNGDLTPAQIAAAQAANPQAFGSSGTAVSGGGAFGGGHVARASGGPVQAGQTYTVGENGPETLVMGSQSGNIVPADTGGNITIPINIDGRQIAVAVAPYLGRIKRITTGAR
jgi:hypothetical protein